MAVTLNAKGTSVPYFKIGKGGTTLYQGSADPALSHSPIENDIWIDSANLTIRYRSAQNTWETRSSASITVSATAPNNPVEGELWFDNTDTGKIFIWLGSEWVDTSPAPEIAITLSELTDVDTANVTDGQVISYDAANSTWTVSDKSAFDLATKTTDDLSEGLTNLYFTNERVDDRVASLLTAGSNITLTYDDVAGTLTIDAVEDNLANNSTSDLAEGTNLYYTDARARSALSATGDISYNNLTGVISYTAPTNVSAFTNDAGYLTSETSHADVLVDGDFATAGIMSTDGAGTYSIVTNNAENWNTAYGWGDHSTAGYLTSYTETDPVYSASAAATITLGLIGQWNDAYGWGDHSLAGYLTSETYSSPTELIQAIRTVDGVGSLLDSDLLDGQHGNYYLEYTNFTNTPSIPSSSDDLSEGSTNLFYTSTRATDDARSAISVSGDLSYNITTGVISYAAPTNVSAFINDSGYLTSVSIDDLTDVSITSPTEGQVITYDANSATWINTTTSAANWDTAYGWGDHSLAGYLTSETYSTASELLTAIKTVDGTASGLDADLWDGNQFASYLNQPVRTGDNVTFNDVSVSGVLYSDDVTASNVTITGNLSVSGTVVTVNSETVTIADNIFLLNSNVTGTPTENAGIEIERGIDINVLFIWDEVNDRWTFGAEDVYSSGTATLGGVVTNFGSATDINLENVTTSNLPEGTNLYYTDARVDARIALNETNDYVDGVSFNSGDGVLTLTRTGALSDLTTNLDGRYQIAGSYDNYVSWTASDGSNTAAVTSGETVVLSGSGATTVSFNPTTQTYTISSTDTNTDTHLSGLSFNTTNGILTATLSDASTVVVDLDGRYSQTDTTYSAGAGLTLTGTTFSANVNGGLEIDVNDDIIISDTTVTSGSYGSADSVATFNVNTKGQITSASNTQISITASQVSDFDNGVKAAMSQTHSSVYVVTASDETTNSGANLPITANTLGFNLAGKEIYMVYLNRLLLRPTEYTLDNSTGTITFQQGILAQNDEIEAVYYG